MIQLSDWVDGVNSLTNHPKSKMKIYNDYEEYYTIIVNYEEVVNDYNVVLSNKYNDFIYTDFLDAEDFNQAKFRARKKVQDYFIRESMFYESISYKLEKGE
mgnify:CR=1 FL=1